MMAKVGIEAEQSGLRTACLQLKSDIMSEEHPKITAYLKTFCGWSEGVRAIMRKHDLQFEEKDIVENTGFPLGDGTAQRPAALAVRGDKWYHASRCQRGGSREVDVG